MQKVSAYLALWGDMRKVSAYLLDWDDMQKVSGYPALWGGYTESFRLLNVSLKIF